EMRPTAVASVLAALGRRRFSRIAFDPLPHIEIVELLAPQHPGKSLPLDAPHILVVNVLLLSGVKGVCLGLPLRHHLVDAGPSFRSRLARAQPKTDRGAAVARNGADIESPRFGALTRGIDRFNAAVDDVFVEGVLAVALRAADAE